jgi:hypothetical protein
MTQQQIADFLGRKFEPGSSTPPDGGTTTSPPPTTTTRFTEEIRQGSYLSQNALPELFRTQLAVGWQPSAGGVYIADNKYLKYDGTGFYEVTFQNGPWVRK